MTRPLVLVVGDALLDRDVDGAVTRVAPDAPVPVVDETAVHERPGGAGLAALLLARSGRTVRLAAPWCDDPAGRRLRELLAAKGVELVPLPVTGGATREKTRIRSRGQTLVRWDRGSAGTPAAEPAGLAAAARGAGAVLVACYGGGASADPAVRTWLTGLTRSVPVVWDPHPRGAEPVPGCAAVTPNLGEARDWAARAGGGPGPGRRPGAGPAVGEAAALAGALRRRWEATSVAVTLGERGALLSYGDGAPIATAPPPGVAAAEGGDTCGAGDRFAGELAAALGDGALVSEGVAAAVRAASAYVAAGGAAVLRETAPVPAVAADARGAPEHRGSRAHVGEAPGGTAGVPAADAAVSPVRDGAGAGWPAVEAVRARVRAAGGTLVATGGCFDLLHAGHVRYLAAARALGDALVVLVNDDDSVRRLKGPDRPLQPVGDRADVLVALDAVDAVVSFGEDTPVAALERLRPDLWVKGGDYAGGDLPEAPVVAGWGGSTVVVPYLDGRSTSGIIRTARTRTAGADGGASRRETTP